MSHLVRQAFHIVRTCPGINTPANLRFVLQVKLCITSNPCRKIRRKRNGLVQGICMQALGMSQGSSHSFCTSTGYVVKGVLFGK